MREEESKRLEEEAKKGRKRGNVKSYDLDRDFAALQRKGLPVVRKSSPKVPRIPKKVR